jgi:copper homeostasis protein
MIRERDGDFVYSDDEILSMQNQIENFKSIGILEVVFGTLNINNKVDIQVTNRLAMHAFPMNVTFHKAIDQTKNILSELQTIKSIPGISSVLTSGGKSNAESGYKIIKEMINVADNKINIIAAGSITNKNLEYLHNKIGAMDYHGRKIVGGLN